MSETIYVEVHAAEGGDDAKSLVHDQIAIYLKAAAWRGL